MLTQDILSALRWGLKVFLEGAFQGGRFWYVQATPPL